MPEARRRQAVARLQGDREWASSTRGQRPAGTLGGETGKTQVPEKGPRGGGEEGRNWRKKGGVGKGKKGTKLGKSSVMGGGAGKRETQR
jgi:hypothetical protein